MAKDSQEILIHPMSQENPQANNVDEEVQNIMPIIQEPKEQNQNDLQKEVAKNQLQESLVPLLQGQQENFLHLDLPEDALMNEQEMHEIQNKEDDIPMDWQGNGHVVVNDIHLGMVRIFQASHPTILIWPDSLPLQFIPWATLLWPFQKTRQIFFSK